MNNFVLIKSDKNYDRVKQNLFTFIENLPEKQKWQVDIKKYRLNRTDRQNRYLFGVVYKTIEEHENGFLINEEIEQTLMRGGASKKDFIHEFFGSMFLPKVEAGDMVIRISTTKLDTAGFSEYVDNIRDYASAHMGIYIPSPQEMNYNDWQKWYER